MKSKRILWISLLLALAIVVGLSVWLVPALLRPSLLSYFELDGLTADNIESVSFYVVYDRGMRWDSSEPAVLEEVCGMLDRAHVAGEYPPFAGPTISITLNLHERFNGKDTVQIVLGSESVQSPDGANQDYWLTDYYTREEWTALFAKCEQIY